MRHPKKTDSRTAMKRQKIMKHTANPSVKLKEVQPSPQANAVAPHLILP